MYTLRPVGVEPLRHAWLGADALPEAFLEGDHRRPPPTLRRAQQLAQVRAPGEHFLEGDFLAHLAVPRGLPTEQTAASIYSTELAYTLQPTILLLTLPVGAQRYAAVRL